MKDVLGEIMFGCLFGHKWVYSKIVKYNYVCYPSVERFSERTCERCGYTEKCMSLYKEANGEYTGTWFRIR